MLPTGSPQTYAEWNLTPPQYYQCPWAMVTGVSVVSLGNWERPFGNLSQLYTSRADCGICLKFATASKMSLGSEWWVEVGLWVGC